MNDINVRSSLKLIVSVLIGIVVVWLVFTLFNGIGSGYGVTGSIYVLLILLSKLLFALFILGLVIGIAVAAKRYLFTEDDINNIKNTFKRNRTVVVKETCIVCSKEQNDDWKVCPFCGQEKEINQ